MQLELWIETALFQGGYNSSVVMAGVILLGLAAGTIGTFTMLNRQALVVDAFAHASLAGVAGAFLVQATMTAAGTERSLPVLMVGAGVAGLAGVAAITWLSTRTRLAADTATAAVSSSMFGLGIVLLSLARRVPGADRAGLDGLIFGSTASMSRDDALLMGGLAVVCLVATAVFHRPLIAVAFNRRFAVTSGLRVGAVDALLAALAASVALAGLAVVGLVLVVATLVVPPATARLWVSRAPLLIAISAAVGGVSAWLGASLSAAIPNAPTGSLIVLVGALFFLVSLCVAPDRGLVSGWLRRRRLRALAVECAGTGGRRA